jgi:hypothetical protein
MLRTAASHTAHLVMEALLGAAGLIVIAGCVLAWRLGQGPIDITSLARREIYRLPTAGARVQVGHAELVWEGFRDPSSALDIRWRDVAITGVDGAALARLAAGRVTLAVGQLLRGQVVPRIVELDGASLALERGTDGKLRLNLADASGTAGGSTALLRDLQRPPGETDVLPFLSQLRHIRLRDAQVTLRDAALGVTWQATAPAIDLDRQNVGGVTGHGALALQSGPARVTLAIEASLTGDGSSLSVRSSAFSPASLAGAAAALAPLAALDAPVQLALSADLSPALALRGATLKLDIGAGTLRAGRGQIEVGKASAELRTDGHDLHLTAFRLTPRPAPAAHLPPPTLTASADALATSAGWHVTFNAAVDRAAFADLAAYWPPGTGGGAQPWITQNITAGVAADGHVTGALDAAADFSGVAVTSLAGGLAATDLTVHWLRPVPPIEHTAALLTIDGPDALHIDVPRGAQGALAVSAGRVRITGLSHAHQLADIALTADGALKPVLDLLNHPRLRLLSRRPIPLNDPAGSVSTKLRMTVPLEAWVTFDQMGVSASAKLAQVHLSAVAAGRDLEHGMLDLAVDPDSLKVTGTGTIGGVPADLGVDMDFRMGPASQVLERYTAHGTATAVQLSTAGLPWLTGGNAALDVDYAIRRDGGASLALACDLGDAALTTPFGWDKPQGQAARAAATLRLEGDRLVGIDLLRASGPGLTLASHAVMVAGQPRTLVLDQLLLGRTQATGSITLTRGAQDELRVALHGPVLDLSAYLKQRDSARHSADDDDTRGRPWDVNLAFGRVILAKDEALAPATVSAASDGLRILHADVSAGAAGEVRARIAPAPGGRRLSVDSADAGAVLLAAGIADNFHGGKLRVDATYDDAAPHAPLSGTATLEKFRVVDAPAIGRLLQAMTLYGAVDLLRGPGLAFSRAVVPFRWRQRVLHMESARAFSASLGLTARGDIDMRAHTANVDGTIVPAYFFNQLLGNIPLLGRVFSPEKGGGVFAARYTVRGPLADPKVGVNPLAALTPGFLRGLFGLF